jgi:hypothetical protein
VGASVEVSPTLVDLLLQESNQTPLLVITEEVTYASACNLRFAHALYTVVSCAYLDMSRFLGSIQCPHVVHPVLPGLGLPEFGRHLCVFSGRLAYFLSSNGVSMDASSSSNNDDIILMDFSPTGGLIHSLDMVIEDLEDSLARDRVVEF